MTSSQGAAAPPQSPPSPSIPGDGRSPSPAPAGLLAKIDQWMAAHPWHPRLAPFFVYVLLLAGVGAVRDVVPESYPFTYTLQCVIVGWMLWRYRKLTPEITWRPHILSLVVGVWCCAAWIWLGIKMEEWFPSLAAEGYNFLDNMSPGFAWTSLILRLLGMSILVSIFEELLYRSMLPRSLYRPRTAGIAFMQFAADLPVIGEWVSNTKWARKADEHDRVLARSFHETPLGQLSIFSVVLTIVLWCVLSHLPRDYPGTIACGLGYLGLLAYTRKMGLGPVIWAHGITNALLWGYTIFMDDWRFL